MSTYARVILTGLMSFPLIALVCLVPYMVYEYRRYGSIPAWKSFVVFSMILYAICAVYMVVLPLPENREVFVAYAARPKLEPFTFVTAFAQAARQARLSLLRPSTVLAFLKAPGVYVTLFNVALTMPVGFYARYLFGARWWQAVVAGLVTSLFFETTQVTGIYGIYAHPYRLFDVDDLIVNTTGALLGFALSAPVCRFLPAIDDVNARARERGRTYPSMTRRLLAFLIDGALALVASAFGYRVLVQASTYATARHALSVLTLMVSVVFVVVPVLARGGTIGQRVLRMRVVGTDADDASPWRVLARQALFWWGFVLGPCWAIMLFPGSAVDGIGIANLRALIAMVWLVWLASMLARFVVSRVTGRAPVMVNALMTGTRLMSVPEIESLRAHRSLGSEDDLDAAALDAAHDEAAAEQADRELAELAALGAEARARRAQGPRDPGEDPGHWSA